MGSLAIMDEPAPAEDALFYQSVYTSSSPTVVSADGLYFTLANGQRILDSTGGAAVSSIGHGNEQVKGAIIKQLNKFTYAHPGYFQNAPAHELADLLVKSTGGQLSRACLLGSGSEAVEAAMKLARQYFLELDPKAPRTRFIARQSSWHGCTLGTLAVGDLKARKEPFTDVLADNVSHVSPCHPYRHLRDGETAEEYVVRLAAELDAEFRRVGPENVCAFIIEPMVGTALGCVTALPGYLQAVKDVCHRHGALVIFDEVMCGLGRTGYMHAWQHDNVVPDIQAVGKGLAAGYGTISALLIHERVIDGLKQGSASFQHGQTYQCHPLNVVAAVEVQRVVRDRNLVRNARLMGIILGHLLRRAFSDHPHVGDVRGRGMFWCVEFVADRNTKAPLDPKLNIARRMRLRGLEEGYDVCLFSSTGCADGWNGDHFLLAPPFTVTPTDVEEIVSRAVRVVDSVFEEVKAKGQM
ncbi:putative aminotransferase [Colletotrichum orbiculare MAFF 240422]|uniref:Aminotransferase n=1 Tax=Colletotrichum orbiculare (strain 104-T / ATCC 96160 / CBS 514.97 / LARS 414 / MAFF 240422) TaxID=1213857 RepID=N4VQ82_COLOR|nr:putative aminotransferase [Colletotrichum orbiculare MAFF 240422]